MSTNKKTPITQENWETLEANGLNPEDMGFRIKGTRGVTNITHAPESTQESYKLMQETARSCERFTHEGVEYEVGVYCHKVPVKK